VGGRQEVDEGINGRVGTHRRAKSSACVAANLLVLGWELRGCPEDAERLIIWHPFLSDHRDSRAAVELATQELGSKLGALEGCLGQLRRRLFGWPLGALTALKNILPARALDRLSDCLHDRLFRRR